jgi:hypothetical protein
MRNKRAVQLNPIAEGAVVEEEREMANQSEECTGSVHMRKIRGVIGTNNAIVFKKAMGFTV